MGALLEEKKINLVTEFNIAQADPDTKRIVSYDDRAVEFDLLVTIPVNMGSELIERSGLGDDLSFIPTEKHTLKAKDHDNVFVLGDATNLASSKAGSVAHFQVDVFIENFLRYVDGLESAADLRWPRQLLHRVRPRQGLPHRLQLRRGAAAGDVPHAGAGALQPPQTVADEPLGQDDVPLDLLERAAQRQRATHPGPDEHGRQTTVTAPQGKKP